MNAVTDPSSSSPIKHFIGLIRVSTRKQADDNLSLQTQEHRIRDFVADKQHAKLSIHTETGSASKSSAHRSVLHTAIQEARDKQGTLIVVRVDRLSRNSEIIHLLKGVKIYSMDEGMITPSRLKDLVGAAEREANIISTASKASAAERRARGYKLGNQKNLDVAQRNGCANNVARAYKKVRNLAELFRLYPNLVPLTHSELSASLNKMDCLNHHSASDWVPWTKNSIRSPRKEAMKLLGNN